MLDDVAVRIVNIVTISLTVAVAVCVFFVVSVVLLLLCCWRCCIDTKVVFAIASLLRS